MKPLICPQCGGKIETYDRWQTFATCVYCGSRFLIEKEAASPAPAASPPVAAGPKLLNIALFCGAVGLFIFALLVVVSLTGQRAHPPTTPPSPPSVAARTAEVKRVAPGPDVEPDLLTFGGKGTGNGLFQDASAIAVDKKGRIYVADDTLRVQQFDERGEFLKLWQIPEQTKYYKRARTIQKIAVDDRERLFVLVGGVVQIWDQNAAGAAAETLHSAPEFIVDFALRSDGGRLLVALDGQIETLIFQDRNGRVTRRLRGFHTNAADAALSPRETGLAAIRLAVDGANNIFSLYAFGDLGSYQLSYDAEDLVILRFTPDGRYVNKFVQTMDSCGIALDNQSRIYITRDDEIRRLTSSGEAAGEKTGFRNIRAFALDAADNLYVLSDDRVYKRAAFDAPEN